jgi:ABC-2 type transport system permease protein/lipopolysaccharide transport system permease protein
VYFVAAPLLGRPIPLGIFWVLPGLALFLMTGLGHICIMSYLFPRFRDMPHAIESLFRVLYFLLPIIYPKERLDDRGLSAVYLWNPMYYLLRMIRYPLMEGKPESLEFYGISIGYMIAIWIIALFVAGRTDRKVVYWL